MEKILAEISTLCSYNTLVFGFNIYQCLWLTVFYDYNKLSGIANVKALKEAVQEIYRIAVSHIYFLEAAIFLRLIPVTGLSRSSKWFNQ